MKVLLSSATTFPRPDMVFELAKKVEADGVELLPYRWRNIEDMAAIEEQTVPILGIHAPFWSSKKSMAQVRGRETKLSEKYGFSILWNSLYGSENGNSKAVQIARQRPDAYLLLHPDVFDDVKEKLNLNSRIFLEPERPKKEEPEFTDNPTELAKYIAQQKNPNIHMMFDPRHYQIAQQEGKIADESVSNAYQRIKPHGLHFSFYNGNTATELPDQKTWNEFLPVLKEQPPEFLVVELTPKSIPLSWVTKDYSQVDKAMEYVSQLR